jgi:hypothetical protein
MPDMSWECIDTEAGVWSAEYRVPMMKSRSTAVQLSDGRFLVYSPGSGLESSFAESVGQADVLLAANSFHHLGLPDWRAAFPDAIVAAAPGAHKRLAKQGRSGLVDLEPVRSALPEHVSLLEPPATKIGEVWLRVESERGVMWVVGDSFFNLPRLARRFWPRLLQRLVKSAPGLAMSRFMKWGGLSSRKQFKSWVLAQIEADEPAILIPVHGEVYENSGLPDALRDVVNTRL